MNAIDWTNKITKLSRNEETRQAQLDELDEGQAYLEKYDALIFKAAGFLNKEFPQVPVNTWAAALNNPNKVNFTDEKRRERFEAAQNWISSQI